jgi:Flp pilus assembly protein TadG
MAEVMYRLRRLRDERGSELIELALVLPILLLIVAGIIDFGFLFERYEVVTNAAREGARIGVLPGYTAADIQSRVTDYLNAGGLSGAAATITPTYTTDTLSTGLTVNVVQVTVAYPSQFLSLGPISGLVGGGGGFGTVTLYATSTMRVEAAGGSGP